MDKKLKGIELLDEVLENLENSKFSLFNVIQKLNRVGKLLDEKDLIVWSEIHLGNSDYNMPLKRAVEKFLENQEKKTEESQAELDAATEAINKIGIKIPKLISNEELTSKNDESSGGYSNIGFIEEKYNDLVKLRKGNDGTYYKSNLSSHLSVVKAKAYDKASFYHKKYAYENLPETNFEILKNKIEDSLLEIDPELAEMLMIAFKSVSSDKQEEWSHSLTSCRRFLEKLADKLYPETDKLMNGRSLKKENYINRLWAYMDASIESSTNKEIAKAHVDLTGFYLQNLYKISNKGVHSKLERYEALKTVMHIYLLIADILDYLDKEKFIEKKPNLYTATLDELEIIGGISKSIAKDIIKLRVKHNIVTEKMLRSISGLGEKTLAKFLSNVSIEKI